MNKRTEKEFMDWLKRAKKDGGQLRTIEHREGDLDGYLAEATRRAFTAGVNALRQRKGI